jgi:hypothetical protein
VVIGGKMNRTIALVNGVEVGDYYVLKANDTLEFLRPQGRKGVGAWAKSPEEFCEFFSIEAKTLELWISQGLQIIPTADGSFRITETAFDAWRETKSKKANAKASPYLDIEQVASRIQRTVRGVRGLLHRGTFPTPLPGSHKLLWNPVTIDNWLKENPHRGAGQAKRQREK